MKMNINEKRAYRIGYADGLKQAEKLKKQSKQSNKENLYIKYLQLQNELKNKEVNYGN